MKSFFSKNKKKILFISSAFLLIAIFVFSPEIASADAGKGVAKVLGYILFPFIWTMGQLATLILGVLVTIAQYNGFINSSAVSYGWVIVRDLCNMFFVLILLIIAFASILRVESYNLKTWLPKLVIMAVLINFSKLICGVLIDFAQVVMLTFVNAFKEIVGVNFTDMLGLSKILSFSQESSGEVTAWSIIGSMVLALIFSVIAVVVLTAMLAMLAMRIVYIWIYVVLSPLAYLLASFPQGRSYSQRWWSDFSKNLIVGPLIAFFIWLSFASLGGVEGDQEIEKIRSKEKVTSTFDGSEATNDASRVLTEAGHPDNVIKMVISVGMLLGGLMLSQEMGGAAGKIAGKSMAKVAALGAGSLLVAKRLTGVDRAQRAVKSYQQSKESKRSERAISDSKALHQAAGWTKEKIAHVPQQIGKRTSNLLKMPFSLNDKKLEAKSEEIRKEENELKDYKKEAEAFNLKDDIASVKNLETQFNENENIKQRADDLENSQARYSALETDLYYMDQNGIPVNDPNRIAKQQEFDEEAQNLERLKNEAGLENTASGADVANRVQELRDDYVGNRSRIVTEIGDKKIEIEDKYTALTGEDRSYDFLKDDPDLAASTISGQIEEREKSLISKRQELDESRKTANFIDKGIGAVVGGAIGGVVTAAFGSPLVGMAIGGKFGWGAKEKLAHAGEGSYRLASDRNVSKMNEIRKDIEHEKPETLKAITADHTRTKHERAEAAIIGLEKGDLTNSEAQVAVDYIRDAFKNDIKVQSRLDASLASHYPELGTNLQDLKRLSEPVAGETPEQESRRQREFEEKKEKIVKAIVGGSIKLETINDQNILDMLIPTLANTISTSNLAAMHKNQTSKKQNMIEMSLRKAGDSKSNRALVNITSNLNSLDDEKHKTKYMEGVSETQLASLLSSTNGINSVVDWIRNNDVGILDEIIRSRGDVRRVMETLNKVTKKAQMSMENSGNRASISKLVNALKKNGIV